MDTRPYINAALFGFLFIIFSNLVETLSEWLAAFLAVIFVFFEEYEIEVKQHFHIEKRNLQIIIITVCNRLQPAVSVSAYSYSDSKL